MRRRTGFTRTSYPSSGSGGFPNEGGRSYSGTTTVLGATTSSPSQICFAIGNASSMWLLLHGTFKRSQG